MWTKIELNWIENLKTKEQVIASRSLLCSLQRFQPSRFSFKKKKKGRKTKKNVRNYKAEGVALLSIMLIYNGNWTEWKAIWSEIIRVIFNHKYDICQTKIARHKAQLSLCCFVSEIKTERTKTHSRLLKTKRS